MQSLLGQVAKDSSLPAIKLHKRVSEDLDALAEIERNYEKEIRAVFGRFESRSIELKREKWDSYVAYLKTLYQRERILKDYGVVLPYPVEAGTGRAGAEPGPAAAKERRNLRQGAAEENHRADLRRRPAPPLQRGDRRHPQAVQRAGRVLQRRPQHRFARCEGKGHPERAGAEVSRKLMQAGYVLANHSFSHAQLSKQSGDG
jgi:hypothetical protein